MLSKLFLVITLSLFLQQRTNTVSPNGKFKVTVEVQEESDLQTRYSIKLINNTSTEIFEIANCIRRDFPAPNFYWDKNSNYIIVEQCAESFQESRIKIINLKTKKTDTELTGLIGNLDSKQHQFDAENGILLYFDTSILNTDKIPDLYSFDVKTKNKRKICEFDVGADMEFPLLQRLDGKRIVKINYNDNLSGNRFSKQINY